MPAKYAIGFSAIATLIVVGLAVAGLIINREPNPARVWEPLPDAAAIEPRLSRIATPVTVPMEQLRQIADRRLSGEIFSENREIANGIGVDIAILRRNEPIEMDMTAGWLTTNVPITVTGTPNIRLGPLRISGNSVGGFEADLDVGLRTQVRLNPDWTITSNTMADIEVGRADLTFAGRVTDASPVVSEILDRNLERIAAPLDDYLRDLDIRTMVEPIWLRFREPVQLRGDPQVWLRIRPERFIYSPPDIQANRIRFDIGMEAYLESVVGERPATMEPGSIPDLDEAPREPGSFNVAVPIALHLSEANRILSERITGREDRIGAGAVVRWRAIALEGVENRLRVTVDFEAETGIPFLNELAGVMTLEGRPGYIPSSQTLTMADIDYELDSNSTLARLANWLLHDRLRRQIQNELVLPVDDLIENVRGSLQREMARISFGDYVTAQVSVNTLEPNLLGVSNDTLDLVIVADGTLRLDLNLLPTRQAPVQ